MPGNDAFDRGEIIKAHREAALRRMADYGGTILAVQDTAGVNVHSCLAVTAEGLVLGV